MEHASPPRWRDGCLPACLNDPGSRRLTGHGRPRARNRAVSRPVAREAEPWTCSRCWVSGAGEIMARCMARSWTCSRRAVSGAEVGTREHQQQSACARLSAPPTTATCLVLQADSPCLDRRFEMYVSQTGSGCPYFILTSISNLCMRSHSAAVFSIDVYK